MRPTFSRVRVFEGSAAPGLGARAFTDGRDIHFAPGAFEPDTRRGREMIGHELAHVVQHAQGRVRASGHVNGVALNDSAGLEAEASRLREAAARGASPVPGAVMPAMRTGGAPVVQCFHEGANGERYSKNGDLALLGPRKLYADQTNFDKANEALTEAKAGVELVAGDEKTLESDLKVVNGRKYVKVIPQMRKIVEEQDPQQVAASVRANQLLKAMEKSQPHASSSDWSKRKKHNKFKGWIADEAAKVNVLARNMRRALTGVLRHVGAMYDMNAPLTKAQWGVINNAMQVWMGANPTAAQFVSEDRLALTARETDNPAAAESVKNGIKDAALLPTGVTFKLFVYPSATEVEAFCDRVVARMNRLVESESAEELMGTMILPSDCATAAAMVSGKQGDMKFGDVAPIGGTHYVSFEKSDVGWNFHWAAVIMADGGDTVSLENAADPSKVPIDRTSWYFQMYGSSGDQTFSAQLRALNAARNRGLNKKLGIMDKMDKMDKSKDK